jgi:hypothetical protein
MSKNNPEASAPVVENTSVPSSLSPTDMAQLLELFAKLSAQTSSTNAQTIADALIESRKPYKDPAQEANEEMFRENTRRQFEQERINRKAEQDNCAHIAGCNSLSDERHPSGKSSIIKHYLDSGVLIGICTVCQRVWWPDEPDYKEAIQKPSINRPSRSGQRFQLTQGKITR